MSHPPILCLVALCDLLNGCAVAELKICCQIVRGNSSGDPEVLALLFPLSPFLIAMVLLDAVSPKSVLDC